MCITQGKTLGGAEALALARLHEPNASNHQYEVRSPSLAKGRSHPKITLTPSMSYAKNIAFINLMRQYLEPLNLEISPDSLSQGEPAIRQMIALRQAQHWLQTVTWQQLSDWIVQLSQLPNLDRGYIDILTPRANNTLKEGTIMGLDKPTKYSHPYYWAAFIMTGQG